jgi:CDP-glucose 4,6-dehydratase
VTDASIAGPLRDVAGTSVLVTGHTGFKGAWLSEWLLKSGATVSGIALPPEADDSLFSLLRHEERLDHSVCDIRSADALAKAVRRANPEIVFHLAAQALVRRSYRAPLETWQTNVDGTLNLLEAVRGLGRPVTVVVVTTDKVYRNREWEYAYREDDALGGHDPYSASKAACEIAVDSWRASFGSLNGVRVATARAGNVVGAGDVSEDRLIPDCFRAWGRDGVVELRNPGSSRPWQHVLEPLAGYAMLASHVRREADHLPACNFGPEAGGDQTVEEVVRRLASFHPRRKWTVVRRDELHEAKSLALSIDRARHRLGWSPMLSFDETIAWTNEGYSVERRLLPQLVERQIAEFDARWSSRTCGRGPG